MLIFKTQNEFNIDLESQRSKKSKTNPKILKLYCDITKNIALNKMWIKPNRIYRKIVDTLNWTKSKIANFDVKKQNYHFTNFFDFKIDQQFIWFITNFMKKSQKDRAVMKTIKRHVHWKAQTHTMYKKKNQAVRVDAKTLRIPTNLKN